MNLLFIFWGKKGGGAKYSLEVARELAKIPDVQLHVSISEQCKIRDQFHHLSCPVMEIRMSDTVPGFLFKWLFGRWGLSRLLTSYLRENNIDALIIGMDFFWGPVIYRAAHAAGVKSVLVVHEPKPHPRESFAIAVMKNLVLGKTVRGADYLVALTQHVKSHLVDLYRIEPETVSVVPHGIFSYYEEKNPRRIEEKSVIRLLYFGRIEYYKGLDILLEAFRLLQQTRNDVQLQIVGSGNLSPYRSQIESLDRVDVINRWVDESEIEHFFKSSDLCLMPYREASQSGVAGIAASAALPIVACPSEGLKEQLAECGALLAATSTPESLYDAIRKVIEDPVLYKTLSKKSLEYAETVSWRSIASQFHRISEKLIEDRG